MKADTWRRILAVGAVLALIVVVLVLSQDDRTNKPMDPNGDLLGQDRSESLTEYLARAEESLAAAPAEEPAFALTTFTEPADPQTAAEALTGVTRVNAMILLSAAPIPLPEPTNDMDRTDVFNLHLDRIDHSLSGVGEVRAPREINSVVVWDTGESLRELTEEPEVLAVEALPPDASWGRFGIRPVNVGAGDGTPGQAQSAAE